MKEDFQYINQYQTLMGVDEVGRGPLAGPVVACAALMHPLSSQRLEKLQTLKVGDSKKLSQLSRQKILSQLSLSELHPNKIYQHDDLYFLLSQIEAEEIDQINILQASLKAMRQCVEGLLLHFSNKNFNLEKNLVLIDGNKSPWKSLTGMEIQTLVKGDARSLMIGLASIVAKEYRDNLMNKMDQVYPGYGFSQHVGYPTAFHKKCIQEKGVTFLHRKSFSGVKEYVVAT